MPLLLLFIIVPIIELTLIIKIGTRIGTLNTVALIILTAVVGSYYARREGSAVLQQIQNHLSRGMMPAKEMIDGMLIFMGGAMLLTPGFATDILGLSAILPFSRPLLRAWLVRNFARRGNLYTASYHGPANEPGQEQPAPRTNPRNTTIDADFKRHDDLD